MKILYLIRGIPGSGKSTLARHILRSIYGFAADNAHFEADKFFTDKMGNYLWDKAHIQQAHQECAEKTKYAMSIGTHVIVVSNTFTKQWQLIPYRFLAQNYGYQVVEIIVQGDGFENIHGVPPETVAKFKKDFEYT